MIRPLSFALAALATILFALSASGCNRDPVPSPPPPPPPNPPPPPSPPPHPPPSPPPPSPPPSPPPPSPPPPPQNGNTIVDPGLFDQRSFVKTPGMVLCAIEKPANGDKYGCYAKLPATVYVDVTMFQVSSPESCACGIAMNHQPSTEVSAPNVTTKQSFAYDSADVLGVEFVIWDIETGVPLTVLNKFNLSPSINTKDYVAQLLTDSVGALRTLAGFYGAVNDFNPADWIRNATREIVFMSFTTVISYYEKSGNIYACNENAQPGERLGVPSCYEQGLLDVNYAFRAGHPFRVFQPISTPAYTFKVASGTTTPNGDGPFGDHTIKWFNRTYNGPYCESNADCINGYKCELGSKTCQQCITNNDCSSLSYKDSNGNVLVAATCQITKNARLCQYAIRDYTGGNPPDAIVDCPTKCDGTYCVEGTCVECRSGNDCKLQYSPAGSYAKVCNSTYDNSNKLVAKQCNYVFVAADGAKQKDLTAVIAASAVVGACVLILVVVGVVVAFKKYRSSTHALKARTEEIAGMKSDTNSSPLYKSGGTKASNPLYTENATALKPLTE